MALLQRRIYQTFKSIRQCSYYKDKNITMKSLLRCQLRIRFSRESAYFMQRKHFSHNSLGREKSALFVSHENDQSTSVVELDLDLDNQLENLDALRDNLHRRGMEDFNLDQWIADYRHYKNLKEKVESIQEKRTRVSRQMAEIVRQKDPTVAEEKNRLINQGKGLKKELKLLTKPFWDIEEKAILGGLKLPNYLHNDVPHSESIVIDEPRICHKISTTLPKKNAIQRRLQDNDLLEFSPIGPTAYYLKGDLAVLEQAISRYTQDCLEKAGFTPVVCSDMVKALVVEGCGVDIWSPDEAFRLYCKEDESESGTDAASGGKLGNTLFLTGSTHFGMIASLTRMMANEVSLPIKCFTIGRSYSPVKEHSAGESLLSVSQLTEYHMFTSCKSKSQAAEMISTYLDVLLNVYKPFDLCMRLVNVGAKNLHCSESKRQDIECWIPSLNSFIKLASISSCSDYFSRRLMMQCSKNMMSTPRKYQHIVHGGALIMPRFIVALLENSVQQNDQVVLPDVLKPFWIGPLPNRILSFLDS